MEHNTESTIKAPGKVWNAVTIALLILALFLLVLTVSAVKEYKFIGSGVPVSNTISVSGEGEVFAVPDIATFSFSVIEEADDVSEAQNTAAEKTNAALAFLEEQGIDEKDIKTLNYNSGPLYEWVQPECTGFRCPPGERQLTGYEVSQTIQVKVRDVEKAGDVLSGIGALAIQNISGLNFTIDDEDKLARDARKAAIDDAKEKAQILARDLDVDLVRVVSFFEESGGYYPRFEATAQAFGGDFAEEKAVVPSIPTGENKVNSRVTVIYEIR